MLPHRTRQVFVISFFIDRVEIKTHTVVDLWGSKVTKLLLEKRLVVARVLTRYVDQHTDTDGNEAVLAALEKWIDLKPTRIASKELYSPQSLFLRLFRATTFTDIAKKKT